MSEGNNEEFKLNLDAKEFIEQALAAKESITSLSEASSLTALTEGILAVAAPLAVLGVAFFALKETIDLVFDAEKIKLVQAQFEIFSKSAGVSAEKLKQGLLSAAQGWASEGEILQAANKALVELQVGADKIPQIMDLARKATAVFGGTLIERFEGISRSIASGNTKMLKSIGLTIDQNKAFRDYAASIDATVGSLTQAGRQQAIMNAVLEKGKTSLGNVNTNIREATNAWEAFKSTMKDIGEMATLVWDKLFGEKVRSGLNFLRDWATGAKTWFTAHFGEGAEQAAAKTSLLTDKIMALKVQIIDLEQIKNITRDPILAASRGRELDQLREKLKGYQAELGQATEAQKKFEEVKEKEETPKVKKPDLVDHQKVAQEEAAFQQRMLAIKKQYTQEELKQSKDATKSEALYRTQIAQEQAAIDIKIKELTAQKATGITGSQVRAEIALLNKLKAKKIADENEIAAVKQKALERNLSEQKKFGAQVEGAAKLNAHNSAEAWKKSGGLGGVAMSSFQSQSTSAFKAIGDGSKTAADAMKDAFMGMLGDMATKQGEFMMLDAFKTFPAVNVGEFAAGAGLVALGGALGGMSSGSGASPSIGGSSGTAGGASTGAGNGLASATSPTAQNKSAVNITIQGHMFQTQETQNWLVNTIRAASDSTDFNIAGAN